MTELPNDLGDYLRARRELVTPQQVGIQVVGMRRVAGLRREEVAMLAGISAEYYLRLEQGRDRNPSAQVLESIARVLQLDADTTAYLLELGAEAGRVGVHMGSAAASRSAGSRSGGSRSADSRRSRKEPVPAGIAALVATLPLPAFVEGRYFDVLAANPLAAALSPRLVVGRNRLRDVFLDEEERALYPEWELVTAAQVAGFRQSVGTNTDDPRFIALVGELSLASDRFRQLWARHDVRNRRGAAMSMNHPQVGELRLNREKLSVTGADGMMLAIFHPDAGSEAADKLSLLASAALPVAGPGAVFRADSYQPELGT